MCPHCILWFTIYAVMENCYFSYASYISVLNACITNLPLPFSIITSKHIFEVGIQIPFGFGMKLALTCLNRNPKRDRLCDWAPFITPTENMSFGAKLCGEVLLQCRHFGVALYPINRKHIASLMVSRLLCLLIYTVWNYFLYEYHNTCPNSSVQLWTLLNCIWYLMFCRKHLHC